MEVKFGIDTLFLHFSDEERASVEEAAQELGLSLNEFILKAVQEKLAASSRFNSEVN